MLLWIKVIIGCVIFTIFRRVQTHLTQSDLIDIELSSESNNSEAQVSDILYIYNGINYQILEGKPKDVEIIMNKIRKDTRHDIIQEFVTYGVPKRVYDGWVMNTINLNEVGDVIFRDMMMMIEQKYM